mmetsp:Transcript_29457/g.28172  ORF Transcript_29457/g.28172 Transcript_29457/m.28172 type:complete len:397 (+) Transcript_29457:304-1494(+)
MLLFNGRNFNRCRRIQRVNSIGSQILRMKSSHMDYEEGKSLIEEEMSSKFSENAKKNEIKVISSAKLELTKDEHRLFSMLRRVVKDESLGTTIRVAGGWVRDKLLDSGVKEDIDIALDNITGKEFVTALNKWNRKRGLRNYRFSIIASNPGKFKHLETVTLTIYGFLIDCVNLRTETYADNGIVENNNEGRFGTPLVDAVKRDFTMNSLFYNIHTGCIEDYTGRGVSDLKQGLITTPISAVHTLNDDPLRILRAIRFACRFSFDISYEVIRESSDPSVNVFLGTKVARERIFNELEKMFLTEDDTRAILLMHYMGLLPIVLPVPEEKYLLQISNEMDPFPREINDDSIHMKKIHEKKNEKLNTNINNRVNNKEEYNSLYMSPGNSSGDSHTSFKSP